MLADGHVRFAARRCWDCSGDRRRCSRFPTPSFRRGGTLAGACRARTGSGATGDPIHEFAPDNVCPRARGPISAGDTPSTAAAHVAGANFAPATSNAYIEPEAGHAEIVEGPTGAASPVRLHPDALHGPRRGGARTRHSAEDVRIVPTAVGGGFGGKLDVSIQPRWSVAAWKMNRPVACVYTRAESMASTTKRHPADMRARLAPRCARCLMAVDFAGDFNTGALRLLGRTVANRVPVHASGPYAVPNVRAP